MEKKETKLDYLYSCYRRGLPVTNSDLKELKENGYDVEYEEYEIRETFEKKPKQTIGKGKKGFNLSVKRDYTVYSEHEHEREDIDEVDIVLTNEEYDEFEEPELLYEDEIDDSNEEVIIHGFNRITTDDWKPKSVIYHTKEFYNWIDSINSGFKNRIPYEPFNKYVQQAKDWIAKGYDIDHYRGADRVDFIVDELDRCAANTLYFANKYAWIQEASEASGRLKYIADENYIHHQILLYLLDCGYSVINGKPRQIGATTVLGIGAIAKTLTKVNHFLKFITQDKDTGLEIFRDKMMYPYSQLPEWMRPQLRNDRENLFSIDQSGGKKRTTKRGSMAKIQVDAPTRTAINGGSPQLVFLDEIGSISILSEMMNEGRPTMFVKNRITGLLEQRRQVFGWSTGTSEKGGAAFEKEWNRTMSLWEQREPSVGIVPVFFDWSTRCDEKFYLEQKRYYYGGGRASKDNIDIETSRIQFHQHYPSTPADMFIPLGKTLVSRESIETNLTRIRENLEKAGVVLKYGYFEPIFDRNKPKGDNAPLPFEIIGANFIQTDPFDERVTTEILIEPDPKWRYRFYGGTDPITTDTGASRMATVIWDEQFHTIAAITDCKIANDPNYSFLQSMLLTVYYGRDNMSCPEIVERNISLSYRNYRESFGYLKSLLINAEIDPYYQSGAPYDVGIDNRSKRTSHIISKLGECVNVWGDRFYHTTVFRQLSTFHATVTRTGTEVWSAIDKRYYNDDVLFGLVYAYICARSINKQPETDEQYEKRKTTVKYKRVLDGNYEMRLQPQVSIYGERR